MEKQPIFVEECLPPDLRAETPLKVIQFWHRHPMPRNASLAEVHAFFAPHGPDAFTKWRTATDALDAVEDKLDIFGRFATIEDEFEPLENMVDDTVELRNYSCSIPRQVTFGTIGPRTFCRLATQESLRL